MSTSPNWKPQGWPDDRNQVAWPLQLYLNYRYQLTVQNDIIYKQGGQVMIPYSMLAEILNNNNHANRFGLKSNFTDGTGSFIPALDETSNPWYVQYLWYLHTIWLKDNERTHEVFPNHKTYSNMNLMTPQWQQSSSKPKLISSSLASCASATQTMDCNSLARTTWTLPLSQAFSQDSVSGCPLTNMGPKAPFC